MCRRPRSQRGHTFVELMLVLSVIPIMIGIWLGTVDFAGDGLDRAVRRIESDLRFCQRLAMMKAMACGFNKLDTTHYQMYAGTIEMILLDPLTHQTVTTDLTRLHPQLAFSGALSYQIEFGIDGLAHWIPMSVDPIAIQLQLGARTRQVMVAQQTGYIVTPPEN